MGIRDRERRRGASPSRRIARLALAVAAFGLAALGAEGGLRLAGVGSPHDAQRLVLRWVPGPPLVRHDDDRIAFTLRPDYHGALEYRRVTDDEVVLRRAVTVTDDGFREDRRPDPDTADGPLILGVGDSITFGQGVADDETYLAELGRQLGSARVRNAGVPSWCLAQEIAWLEQAPAARHADVVLLGFYVNDLDPPIVTDPAQEDRWSRVQIDAPGWAMPPRGLRRHSHLVSLLYRHVELRQIRRDLLQDHADLRDALRARFAEERAARMLTRDLGRLAEHGRDHGVRCVVLLFPLFATAHSDPLDDVLARVGDAARAHGLEVLDLTPAVQDVPPDRLFVLPGDPHPGPEVHRRMGRCVADYLETHPIAGAQSAGGR